MNGLLYLSAWVVIVIVTVAALLLVIERANYGPIQWRFKRKRSGNEESKS